MSAAQIRFFTLSRREVNRFMKIKKQTIGAPLLETFLYISVFGAALGSRIDKLHGIDYIEFVVTDDVSHFDKEKLNTYDVVVFCLTTGEIKLTEPQKAALLDMYDLHFGPWDTLAENHPFYGGEKMPAGAISAPDQQNGIRVRRDDNRYRSPDE